MNEHDLAVNVLRLSVPLIVYRFHKAPFIFFLFFFIFLDTTFFVSRDVDFIWNLYAI